MNDRKDNLTERESSIMLDYIFGEGEGLEAYQLIRFDKDQPWLVLQEGLLLATINKNSGLWQPYGESSISPTVIADIGKFIDAQHFNFLPEKIKKHWETAVEEVIMQTDSLYLVICKPGVDFESFRNIFSTFIAHLVEDEWAIEFIVYDADFSHDFLVRVF